MAKLIVFGEEARRGIELKEVCRSGAAVVVARHAEKDMAGSIESGCTPDCEFAPEVRRFQDRNAR